MSKVKVVQFGVGDAGRPILDALVASNKFDVTIVSRPNSSYTSPYPSVHVAKVELTDKQALTDVMKGHDVALITLGGLEALERNTKAIVDAAIAAGVRRVIPSEFGVDTTRIPEKQKVAYATKLNIHDYLDEKVAEGSIEYTLICTGLFFDWGLQTGFFGIDIHKKKASIFSGGNNKFDSTTLDGISRGVAAVLLEPSAFKNKAVRIHDFFVTQNEILSVLEEETGSKYEVEEVDADELLRQGFEAIERGEFNEASVYKVVKGSLYGTGESPARWGEEDESTLLGLPKKDLREEVRKVLSG